MVPSRTSHQEKLRATFELALLVVIFGNRSVGRSKHLPNTLNM